VTLNVAAIEDAEYKQEKIGFWKNVYGVNMECLGRAAMAEPLVDCVDKKMIVSNICPILDVDITKVKKEDLDFSNSYALTMLREDKVHAVITWFDSYFTLPKEVKFSTGPYTSYTHWKQTVFYLSQDLQVKEGDLLYGSFAIRKSKENFRDLDIKISFHIQGHYVSRDFVQLFKLR